MRLIVQLLVGCLASSVLASGPGQPLDCSDWVSVAPGLVCAGSLAGDGAPLGDHGPGAEELRPHNEGGYLRVRFVLAPLSECSQRKSRVELVRLTGQTETVLGYFEARVNDCAVGSADAMSLETPFGRGLFSPMEGEFVFRATSLCESCINPGPQYPAASWDVAIRGLTTTFDVLQTFTPTANAIGFRVPYMPEGMPAADHFDTYYGPLTHPIVFSQAQALSCDYPSAVPAVGDHLELADTLPHPTPGTGRYYVTAATYQGQTRYGRKTTNRVMSGRDPAALPACTPELSSASQLFL